MLNAFPRQQRVITCRSFVVVLRAYPLIAVLSQVETLMLKSHPLVPRLIARCLSVLGLCLVLMRVASAQPVASPSSQLSQPGYVSQILTSAWRATFPYRPAFGSLCSLAPLSCALIDRPFALNVQLDLIIRPQAPDGSTGALLPFAVSVPLVGRAEFGMGSCYAGFWGGAPAPSQANTGPSGKYSSGLCPFYIAGKLLLFPWFADPHEHPALALEYLFEYQAGPFSGLNQIGLPGPLSKVSLAYRHPLGGGLELGAALSVLVDHTSHAGTVQFGPQLSYHLPIAESFWAFAQVVVQAPSWGPLVPTVVAGQTVNLAPPFSGAVSVGLQQRTDFGLGIGVALSLAKSTVDTNVSLSLRVPSVAVGPNIKPWYTPREKKAEPAPAAVAVTQPPPAELVCPPGMQLSSVAQPPTQPGSPLPGGALPAAPAAPSCVPIPPVRPPSPLWGHPCYLAPFDGSPQLRMGTIDSTGEYCEWDGLRLPLGAVISPPGRAPPVDPPDPPESPVPPSPGAPPPSTAQGIPTAQNPQGRPHVPGHKPPAAPHSQGAAGAAAAPKGPLPASAPSQPAPRRDPAAPGPKPPQSVPGSAFASGFADRAKNTYKDARAVYNEVKEHGVGVVLPSQQEVAAWLRSLKQECLDQFQECLEAKAAEAADDLNKFAQKPWEDKKYAAGGWAFDALVNTVAAAALPGGGVVAGTLEHAAETEAEKVALEALARKAAEAEAKRLAEQEAKRAAEAAAQRIAEEKAKRAAEEEAERRAEERARRAAEEKARRRAEQEAKDRAERAAREQAERDAANASNRLDHERYKQKLRKDMEPPHVADPELADAVKNLYRDTAEEGSGSTAAAVRNERKTGQPTKGKFHSEKAEGRIRQLESWLRNHPNARPGDRAAAENLLQDMKNAMEGELE